MKKIISLALVMVMMLALVACGNKGSETPQTTPEPTPEAINVPVKDIATKVAAAYGDDYAATMDLDETTIKEVIGIDPAWAEEIHAAGAMISANCDKLIIVKAKSENLEDVKKAMNTYRDALVADLMQYPMNQLKIQASQVDVYGNYVIYTCLGFIPMEVEEKGDDAILEAYKAENQKAVAVYDELLK